MRFAKSALPGLIREQGQHAEQMTLARAEHAIEEKSAAARRRIFAARQSAQQDFQSNARERSSTPR